MQQIETHRSGKGPNERIILEVDETNLDNLGRPIAYDLEARGGGLLTKIRFLRNEWIKPQKGPDDRPLPEGHKHPPDGVTAEVLLAILIHRLGILPDTKAPYQPHSGAPHDTRLEALGKLHEALFWLKQGQPT
jgi:hypothetical protein